MTQNLIRLNIVGIVFRGRKNEKREIQKYIGITRWKETRLERIARKAAEKHKRREENESKKV